MIRLFLHKNEEIRKSFFIKFVMHTHFIRKYSLTRVYLYHFAQKMQRQKYHLLVSSTELFNMCHKIRDLNDQCVRYRILLPAVVCIICKNAVQATRKRIKITHETFYFVQLLFIRRKTRELLWKEASMKEVPWLGFSLLYRSPWRQE